MLSRIIHIITRLNLNSHKIFLVDAIGALLSGFGNAIALYVTLATFDQDLPAHQQLLYTSGFFMIYSLTCYFLKAKFRPFLLILILLNSVYLLLLLYYTLAPKQTIPASIFSYFMLEALVILIVIILEVAVLKMNNTNSVKGKRV